MSLLELDGVEAFYGASQALFGVSLDISEGEVVALMGRNGMGKTTTISSILGLVRARAGAIRLGGRTISGMSAHRIARLGIGLVPEGRRCFPNLTVRENLIAAARKGAWTIARADTVPGILKQIACDGVRANPPLWPTVRAFIEAGRS